MMHDIDNTSVEMGHKFHVIVFLARLSVTHCTTHPFNEECRQPNRLKLPVGRVTFLCFIFLFLSAKDT